MSSVIVAGDTSGSVTLQAPAVSGSTVLTLPAVSGTLISSGGAASFTDLTTTGNTILGNASTDTLNVGNGGLVKDASGNVGIGLAPSASTSNYRTLQIGASVNSFSMLGQRVAGSSEGFLGWNIYGGSNTTTLGSGFYYRNTGDSATLYTQNAQHTWYTAPSGTAGNAITFTQAMTLDASSFLTLQGTTANLFTLNTDSGTGTNRNWRLNNCGAVAGGLSFQVGASAGAAPSITAMTLDASSNLTVNGYFLTDGFSSPTTKYYSLRNGYVPNAAGGVGMMAANLGTGNNDGLQLSGHQGIIFSTNSGTERVRIDGNGITSTWYSSMIAAGGATPSPAVSAAQYYGWAAASARGSWQLAGGSPQYVAYYTGGNNDYLVWNLLCHQGSSLSAIVVYHNHADSASRTAAVDYSFNGGSTWINLATVTFTSSGGTSIGGTISLTGAQSLGRNVRIRTYFVSGATPSSLIGVGQFYFGTTGGSFQYINSLG